MKRKLLLGCIADDVTGATDLAINLVQGGLRVVQVLGVPSGSDALADLDADAIVVALKTRSVPREDAVSQTLLAVDSLKEAGAQRVFFKYCSTFDSTDDGNIGPVAAALMKRMSVDRTIFCPAFPRNGRTVYYGHLFVNGQLLNESGMQDHPLNPMTDANLVRVLGRQVEAEENVGLLTHEDLTGDAELDDSGNCDSKLENVISALVNGGKSLIVADACNNQHLTTLASAVADFPLVTGGSGIARYLPQAYRARGLLSSESWLPELPDVVGRSLIVSGSCSTMTQRQVARMLPSCAAWRVEADKVMGDPDSSLSAVVDWAKGTNPADPLMVYSTASSEDVADAQRKYGVAELATAIEAFQADVAYALVEQLGVRRLVLAGGETSGAIVQRLKIKALQIGPEICGGVPWTQSMGEPNLALALKSGNFGEEDFFEHALGMLS